MKYAAKSATGVSNANAQGRRLDMYGAHVKAVSESMQQRSGEQPTTGLQMKEQLETIAGTKAMREDRQKDKDRKRGTASRGRAAMEGTIGQGTVSGQERLSEIPEGTMKTRCQRTPTRKRGLSTTDRR